MESFSTNDEDEQDDNDHEGVEGGVCGSPETSPIDKFVSWFFYLLMVAVSCRTRLTSMQVKSQK